MRYGNVLACVAALVFRAADVHAAFSDDFADEALSNTQWAAGNDDVSLQFTGGVCRVVNSNETYSGIAPHTFPEGQKPSTFTLSGKVTLDDVGSSAGFVCCLSMSGSAPGYYIAIGNGGYVTVTKISSEGSGSLIKEARSGFLRDGANVLKISRRDGVFNIFCNNVFTATFTDNDFVSGDIGLLVAENTTATFDDIVMTDEFEEGTFPNCFGDGFNDTDLLGWSAFGDLTASVRLDDSTLRITTTTDEHIYQVVDLGLEEFMMKTVVSFRSGSTQKLYGLFLCGTSESTIPIAGFGITGGRSYGVFSSGQSITLTPSTRIKGAPYISSTFDTTYYLDTIEVIKRGGSTEYLFVINGDTLSRYTGVDFGITGVGLFCMDSLDIRFDNFVASEGDSGTCEVPETVVMHRRPAPLHIAPRSDARMYDLCGRRVGRGALTNRTAMTPGVYVRSMGRRELRVTTR